MAGTRKLAIEIVGDAKGVSKAFGQAESDASSFGSKLGGIGKKASLAIAGIGVAGIGAAAVLGPALLDAGAALETIGIKSKTVFGDSVGDVEEWAKTTGRAMGLTSKQAVGMAASMGDLLKPMGFTSEEAANMSTQMLDLSGALSAWSGGTVDAATVSDIMTKAMLGETDGLKQLGISISAAEVEAKLLAKGQSKLTGAALAQAKALATQELIMEKSTDAQAAWANGSMDGIKAQNASKASIAQLKETLVTALYPALQAIVPVITNLATWLGEKLPVAFAAVKAWVDTNWPPVRDVILGVVAKIRTGLEAFAGAVQQIWQRWGAEIFTVARTYFGYIKGTIENAITVVRGVIQTVTSLIKGDWTGVWNGIKTIISGVWDQIKNLVSTALSVLKVAISVAWDLIKLGVKAAWDGVLSIITGTWDRIRDGVSTGIDAVVGFVAALPRRITSAVGSAFDALKNKFRDAINWIIEKWNGLSFTIGGGSYDPLGKFGPDVTVPAFTFNTPNLPRLHTGGMVGGRTFAGLAPDEVAAVLRKGETVLRPEQLSAVAGGGGGNVYQISVNVAPTANLADVGRATVEAIKAFERTGGPVFAAAR